MGAFSLWAGTRSPLPQPAEELNEYLPKLRKTADARTPTPSSRRKMNWRRSHVHRRGLGRSARHDLHFRAGLSLMTEFAVWPTTRSPGGDLDVTRIGPSTGMPTRTSQGDIKFAANMGHGDTDNILLCRLVNECFEFGWRPSTLPSAFRPQ